MGIWNGFDEADIAIHREEIAAGRAAQEREQTAELEAVLREECDRLSGEGKVLHRVSSGYWDLPEFAAVREALDREGTENEYYWSWYERLVAEWRPLNRASTAALEAAHRAHQAWEQAYRASAV